jgi:hypothetical protein
VLGLVLGLAGGILSPSCEEGCTEQMPSGCRVGEHEGDCNRCVGAWYRCEKGQWVLARVCEPGPRLDASADAPRPPG